MEYKFAKVMDNSYTFRSCLFALSETRFQFEVDNFYTIMQLKIQKGLRRIINYITHALHY